MVIMIKNKRYRVNKFKFVRGIICTLILIWMLSMLISSIADKVFKHDEIASIENINETDVINIIDVGTPVYASDTMVDKCTIDYSIKPDGLDNTYYEWMIEISNNEEVPLEVILGIVTTENASYNPNVTNKNSNGTVDMGMCQINSAYVDYFAKKYNIDNLDPYDVYDAVTFVARHMKDLSKYAITHYDLSETDSYIFAAGAYNRGLGNECKYRNMYHYKEKFLSNYNKFIK